MPLRPVMGNSVDCSHQHSMTSWPRITKPVSSLTPAHPPLVDAVEDRSARAMRIDQTPDALGTLFHDVLSIGRSVGEKTRDDRSA